MIDKILDFSLFSWLLSLLCPIDRDKKKCFCLFRQIKNLCVYVSAVLKFLIIISFVFFLCYYLLPSSASSHVNGKWNHTHSLIHTLHSFVTATHQLFLVFLSFFCYFNKWTTIKINWLNSFKLRSWVAFSF